MEGKEDERREAAIASAPCLNPNFKSSRVSQAQLSKFQELHKRRLQIKEKSNTKRKSKGKSCGATRLQVKNYQAEEHASEIPSKTVEDTSESIAKESNTENDSFMGGDRGAAQIASKKRQKLHWGLDTKERWERKSNM